MVEASGRYDKEKSSIVRCFRAEQNGAEHIHYVRTGTVVGTGNRPVEIHVGREGDPLEPSIFDFHAFTKIAGERLVLESDLRYWVSLRITFFMPTTYKEIQELSDAISFHMPFDARTSMPLNKCNNPLLRLYLPSVAR